MAYHEWIVHCSVSHNIEHSDSQKALEQVQYSRGIT